LESGVGFQMIAIYSSLTNLAASSSSSCAI
jgi:hypothetical protein